MKLSNERVADQPWTIATYSVDGFGKTTIGASIPDSMVAMAGNETGYLTLLSRGRVPLRPHLTFSNWEDAKALPSFAAGKCKTLVIDGYGSIDAMLAEFVKRTMFGNKLADFQSYGKGVDACLVEMAAWVASLGALQSKGVNIMLLAHAQVKNFKNPMGSDFDRYQVDGNPKVWAIVSRFFDTVLFGNFLTVVDGNDGQLKKKGKGIGQSQRVLYCERRDAFDAKNRYGMPESLDIPDDPAQAWPTIEQAMKGHSDA